MDKTIAKLLCIVTGVISLWYIIACLPTYGSYLNDPYFSGLFIASGGPFVYEVGMYTIPVWILFHLGYGISAYHAYKESRRAAQYMILFASVGLAFYFFEIFWLYSVGNHNYRIGLLSGMSSAPRNVILGFLNIVVFSKVRLK